MCRGLSRRLASGFEGLHSVQVHTVLPIPKVPPGKTGLLAPLTLDEVVQKPTVRCRRCRAVLIQCKPPAPASTHTRPTPSAARRLLYQSRTLVSSRAEGPAPGAVMGHWKDQDLTGSPAGTFHCHNHTVPSGKGPRRKQLVDCAPGFPYREHTSTLQLITR